MNAETGGCTCGAPTLTEHRHFEGCPLYVCVNSAPHDAHGDCGGVPHPTPAVSETGAGTIDSSPPLGREAQLAIEAIRDAQQKESRAQDRAS